MLRYKIILLRSKTAGLAVLAVCIALTPACDGSSNGSQKKTQSAMVKSTGKFNQGYQQGMKDAQNSLLDLKGADMWLWMADKQFQTGYDRGWNDGRQMAKMKETQRKQLGDRKNEPSPMASEVFRNQAGEKAKAPKLTDSAKTGSGSGAAKKESSE